MSPLPPKALTLWQPWASLVALGVKTIETRSWKTSFRGPLAIHAAKKRPRSYWSRWGEVESGTDPLIAHMTDSYAYGHLFDMQESSDGDGWWRHWWCGPLGAVVATCTLVDVIPMISAGDTVEEPCLEIQPDGELMAISPTDRGPFDTRIFTSQIPYGLFERGRFAWLLEDIKPLAEPIPMVGHQGLWNVPT